MKIYTKKGDKGETGLAGGQKVSKSHLRIRTYGTVDELNSVIGICINKVGDADIKNVLVEIQKDLFAIGGQLATASGGLKKEKTIVKEERITKFEKFIDKCMEEGGPIKSFILPGGAESASFIHLARTVCRRAETLIVELSEREHVDPIIIKYINRLSDLLFAIARALNKREGVTEIPW
ncbi:MAG: cob(I)yrinic acid a,c-diamide adenosyltransferase [Planctomycetes bacterium]|nr:cob(I)yrinic acid a,c-diamide adenosyltransferase [Planctomycetota bacterium]